MMAWKIALIVAVAALNVAVAEEKCISPEMSVSYRILDDEGNPVPDVQCRGWIRQFDAKGGGHSYSLVSDTNGVVTIAGTMSGGWGFHCWAESLLDDLRTVKYQPLQANDMVTDGSITNNPVFNRDFTPMFDACAAQDDQWYALAKCVPAISSPVGGRIVGPLDIENHNLNDNTYRSGWGREDPRNELAWLHSDMKDMSYWYVYKLYTELVMEKGAMK